ncbi:Initiator tRNA phosphoribosyl transferase family protein [Rhynchospora pubera]|uniref:Initiator tRNA phosphoribosyl transferase family protein n=1 Tax=Rhynchospora pubera TaxID=906938 RepID=A0AAV8ENH0_9POAL|nr:Initiator tRNA phosphoribosyl transferase family protein [Rhynchospora pubera]
MEFCDEPLHLSINKAARKIKKRETSSLYNALRSIYEDSTFVAEIGGLWPDLPVVANLRCGLWYTPRFDATCYFKSTDGHQNNWSFSTARLNLHLAILSGQRGGCIIVDSTRKGKRFPDSMSKTIPIWCCVLNWSIYNHLQRTCGVQEEGHSINFDWDTSLHLPSWIPQTEKAAIESLLPKWINEFESCGVDISSLAHALKKPLRPLWISQSTLIWLNEVPSYQSWDFTPVILVSASGQDGLVKQMVQAEFSWRYIPGAGDDEESWARGLMPDLFWKNAFRIIDAGPEDCNRMVSEIVERDRVYRTQRGEYVPQVKVGAAKYLPSEELGLQVIDSSGYLKNETNLADSKGVFWIGSTCIAVASILDVCDESFDFDCMLNCDAGARVSVSMPSDAYLNLPIVSSKMDRFSLYRSLASAVNFAKFQLLRGKRMLICCQNGEDISICVSLAILTCLFDESGNFDGGESFKRKSVTKWEMRKRLVFICNFAIKARPSRGNLKQVFAFLTSEEEH